jgi:predicted NACHT family NTPase
MPLGYGAFDQISGKGRSSIDDDKKFLPWYSDTRVMITRRFEVRQAIINLLAPFQDKVKTITYNNGKEFAEHEQIAHVLEVDIYIRTHPAVFSQKQRSFRC